MKYKKQILLCDTGHIVATIFAENGRKVSTRVFKPFFSSNYAAKKRFRKAHKWADKRMKLCSAQEFNVSEGGIQ